MINYNVNIVLITLAFIYYITLNINIKNLVSIIIIILLFYYYYFSNHANREKDKDDSNKSIHKVDKDVNERKDIVSENYYVKQFPSDLKYLKRNERLMSIIYNVDFVKKFNKSLFSELLIYSDKLMKIYIYILCDRYSAEHYLETFLYTRNNILQILYSLIINIPPKLNHTYNIDTYAEIEKTTNDFILYTRDMIVTIENYSKLNNKVLYLQDTKIIPFNLLNNPNILP